MVLNTLRTVGSSLTFVAFLSTLPASAQQINDGPLKAFQDQYNLSPVPFNVSNADLVPGAIIYRSGMNTTIPLVPSTAKTFTVTKDLKNQPKVTVKKQNAKGFFGSYSGLGAGLNINTTSDIEIGDADITCARIEDADAKALVEKDPQVGAEYRAEGGRREHFMYIASMVCYASDLTLSAKSSKDVLVGVGTVPEKCGSVVSSSDKTTLSPEFLYLLE